MHHRCVKSARIPPSTRGTGTLAKSGAAGRTQRITLGSLLATISLGVFPTEAQAQAPKAVYRQSIELERFRFRRPDAFGSNGEVLVSSVARPFSPTPGSYSFNPTVRLLPDDDHPYMGVQRSKRKGRCPLGSCEYPNDDCRWMEPGHAEIYSDWILENEGRCSDGEIEVALEFVDIRRRYAGLYLGYQQRFLDNWTDICVLSPTTSCTASAITLAHSVIVDVVPSLHKQKCIGRFVETRSLATSLTGGSGPHVDHWCKTLTNTLGDQPAEVQLKTRVENLLYVGNSVGHPCEPSLNNQSGVPMSRFEFAQTGCDQLELRAYVDPSVIQLATTATTFRFYFDTDITGGDPADGADYFISVSTTPGVVPGVLETSVHEYSGGWSTLFGVHALDIVAGQLSVGLKMRFTDIGAAFGQFQVRVELDALGSTVQQPLVELGSNWLLGERRSISTHCPELIGFSRLAHVIEARFREPMDISSTGAGLASVEYVESGTLVPVNTAWDGTGRTLTITPASGSYGPGRYVLTLAAWSDPCGSVMCDPAEEYRFCVEEEELYTEPFFGGTTDEFDPFQMIYLNGSNFSTALATVVVYVCDSDSVNNYGDDLIDQTVGLRGGATAVTVSGGTITRERIGVLVWPGEFIVVADLNNNAKWDPSDRTIGTCDVGLTVEPICFGFHKDAESWWPMDEVTGGLAAADLIGGHIAEYRANTSTGSLPTVVPGAFSGSALSFDGSAQQALRVAHSDEFDFDGYVVADPERGDFTIEGWVRATVAGGMILEKADSSGVYRGYGLRLSGGCLLLEIGDGTTASVFTCGSPINDGAWRHFAVVVDRDSAAISGFYVDGSLLATFDPTAVSGIIGSTEDLWLARGLSGALDDVAVFAEALTSADIALLYGYAPESHCVNDCNDNGVLDADEIALGLVADCNQNGQPDECDVQLGISFDASPADGIPDECQTRRYIGLQFCDANPNSRGVPASIFASGSEFVDDNQVALEARDMPFNAFGYFLASRSQVFVAHPGGSQGNLCVGPVVGRAVGGVVFNTGASGEALVPIDLCHVPTPTGFVSVVPGDTWNFQAWHRDANPGTTSNFTNAVSVAFY